MFGLTLVSAYMLDFYHSESTVRVTLHGLCIIQEALEVISSTPEPWSYQKHLRLTTQLWLTIMPLALLPSLHLATPILGTAIGSVASCV